MNDCCALPDHHPAIMGDSSAILRRALGQRLRAVKVGSQQVLSYIFLACEERSRNRPGRKSTPPTHPASHCARLPATWASQKEGTRSCKARRLDNRFNPQRRWQSARMHFLLLRLKAVVMSMQERAERHVERMAGVLERGVDHIATMEGPEILKSVDRIDKLDKIGRRAFELDDSQTRTFNTLVNVQILDA